MEHRIEKNDEGDSPVIAVILMVAITVVLAAVLYVWAASFLEQGESAPIATFFVSQDSANVYHVEVIKVSKQEDLLGFSFFLKTDLDRHMSAATASVKLLCNSRAAKKWV